MEKLFLLLALTTVLLSTPQCEALRTFTSLNKWYKVACVAENLKETDHYICDSHGYIRCLPGWSNEANLCRDPVCRPPCVHPNGNCTGPNTCTCEVGWGGADCSQCVCLPQCVHGFCNEPFQCICEEGWHGMYCDKAICKAGCVHGHCTKPWTCDCHPGWTGENCDICIKLPGCSEHGTCTKPLECKCEEGYTGQFCDRANCSVGCHPQYGFCNSPGECWCHPGWTGPNCDECLRYPGCQNGICEFPWQCKCNPGWYGKLCDQKKDQATTHPPSVVFKHGNGGGANSHGFFQGHHQATQFHSNVHAQPASKLHPFSKNLIHVPSHQALFNFGQKQPHRVHHKRENSGENEESQEVEVPQEAEEPQETQEDQSMSEEVKSSEEVAPPPIDEPVEPVEPEMPQDEEKE